MPNFGEGHKWLKKEKKCKKKLHFVRVLADCEAEV